MATPGPNGSLDFEESTADVAPSGVTRIARRAGALQQSTDGAPYEDMGTGGGVDAAWFAATLARIQELDATLTDVIVKDECGPTTINWDVGAGSGGTALPSTSSPSAIDIQSNASAGGNAQLTLKGSGTSAKVVPNLRTSRFALAVRVTKIATIATSDLRMAYVTDAVTGGPFIGILGADSTTDYVYKVLSEATVPLGVAQSAAGTYDTLILRSDGTNFNFDINGAVVGTPQLSSQAPDAAGIPQMTATQNAAANSGFRVDKVMLVVGPAA